MHMCKLDLTINVTFLYLFYNLVNLVIDMFSKFYNAILTDLDN